MPIYDRDYVRGQHPPACTCKDCTARRLDKWQGSVRHRNTLLPPSPPHQGNPNVGFLGCVLKLLVVFILLIFGIVIWSLWGNQISGFISGLSTRPSPPVTIELPASPIVPSPSAEPFLYEYKDLVEYALELINRDRITNGFTPVVLGNNPAAQKHAEERNANEYISHWDVNGMKPYMRYTLAGGVNREAENCFKMEITWTGGKDSTYRIDPKEELFEAQSSLMDSLGHRKNILNKWHKKVNLGIAYNNERLDYVQQFEGDYIEFIELPTIIQGHLVMAGSIKLGELYDITIYFDPLPLPLTPAQLEAPPYDYSYSLGEKIGLLLPPSPPDSHYIDLPPYAVVATLWNTNQKGNFEIEADVGLFLEQGKGVYTIVVWIETEGEQVALTGYSMFIN